jgi:protein-tyrosine-phosphatase
MTTSILFVCYGNACRSIMAEALAKHHWANTLKVASAGLTALGYIPKETLRVLQEIGISTDGLYSKGLDEVELERVHLVLDLAAYPLENLIPPTFTGKLIHGFSSSQFGSFSVTSHSMAFRVCLNASKVCWKGSLTYQ